MSMPWKTPCKNRSSVKNTQTLMWCYKMHKTIQSNVWSRDHRPMNELLDERKMQIKKHRQISYYFPMAIIHLPVIHRKDLCLNIFIKRPPEIPQVIKFEYSHFHSKYYSNSLNQEKLLSNRQCHLLDQWLTHVREFLLVRLAFPWHRHAHSYHNDL